MSLLSDDVRQSEIYCEYNHLKLKLIEYLKYGSCDGRLERRPLRKELAELIGEEYDERNQSIKGNK
jgi:hypothetical protein